MRRLTLHPVGTTSVGGKRYRLAQSVEEAYIRDMTASAQPERKMSQYRQAKQHLLRTPQHVQ